jgi:hypothetical protein
MSWHVQLQGEDFAQYRRMASHCPSETADVRLGAINEVVVRPTRTAEFVRAPDEGLAWPSPP